MLALTSISHLATLCYEKQADPRPRYPAVLEHKRLVMDNSAAAIQCVANGHATIIPRVFPSLPPSLKTLASLVDTLEKHGQTIQAAIVTNKRFMLPNNPMAPVDSIYHVHQPKVQPMTPKEALQCATSWKTHQIALTTTIRLDLDIPTLMHNHATTMDNHPTALHVATCPDLLHPLHYTTHPRLFIQLAGRKRYFIVTPDHSFSGLYPFPVHHTYDRYSMVDFDHPRVDQQWPRALDIRGATATLAPGHALYIPAYTWVSTQSLDVYAAVAVVPLQQPQLPLIPYTRALGALQDKVLVERVPLGPSVWVVPPLSAAGGAAALAVSRVVEAIMADALGGVDAVRTWLLHAGRGGCLLANVVCCCMGLPIAS